MGTGPEFRGENIAPDQSCAVHAAPGTGLTPYDRWRSDDTLGSLRR
jgi:hypothetical protein